MNRQLWVIGAAATVLVLIGVVYLVLRPGASEQSIMPISDPARADDARSVISEIEQARTRAGATQAPARAGGEIVRQPTREQAGGGASAVTPAPVADVPSGGSDLDIAFERARDFQRNGQLADAQLLYFYGARAGHGPSAFELAAMNDPNYHSPETSLLAEPDAFQAFRWYTVADEQAVSGAAERLDALRAWAVTASEAGDIEAEQLLLQWE